MNKKKALIVGSTGLVGKALLQILLDADEYEEVIALVRSKQQINHPKLRMVVTDFDKLQTMKEYFKVDDVYCCLGTTIKKAKTQEAMLKVDQEYPLTVAKLASEKGAKQFAIITAMGADPNSTIFYSRMKGEVEKQLVTIPFRSIHIFRPSLLLGNRTEFRLGESVGAIFMKGLGFLLIGPFKKFKAIKDVTVATAMYKAMQIEQVGVNIYPSEKIEQIGSVK